MPFRFSRRSLANLATCDERLQRLARAAIVNSPHDFTVICGHRNEADQNRAFDEGKSRLRWPNSAHNRTPSLAFDFVNYPVDWGKVHEFMAINSHIQQVARDLGIELRPRIDWDLGHIQLKS